jgi:hypothetical protein
MDARNLKNAINNMFERNSRNTNNMFGYTRNVSNSREIGNMKPSEI